MAMGNAQKNDGSKVYFLSERSGKKFTSPHFVVRVKQEDGQVVDNGSITEFSGDLISVKFSDKYNEKTPKGLELANQYGIVKLFV